MPLLQFRPFAIQVKPKPRLTDERTKKLLGHHWTNEKRTSKKMNNADAADANFGLEIYSCPSGNS